MTLTPLERTVPPGPRVGARLRRPARGTPTGRMLLLHGLASTADVWDCFVRCADPDWELWTAELPWESEGDPAWAWHSFTTDWLGGVWDALDGPADVVIAHSFAATLLLEHLAAHPSHLPRAAVLASPFYRPSTHDFGWDTMAYYQQGFHLILEEGIRTATRNPLEPEISAAMALRVRERIGAYGWMRFFDSYLRTPLLPVSSLAVPVLAITGERDVAAPADDARALAAALPHGRAEILDRCGHFPMMQVPARFAAAVHSFLDTTLELP
ncbi:alpha/beta fold hydrolase [Catenuloplanes indicus]|uniref:Pimeloyl-ACP methyl ester carboxylesterase n=1 Tax=Catenuloplanes indicus TaxID=137267 RepID=A0AAE3VTA9_9ACTN|nr:alpha/beta hydrolase [Catenuloplanes indicus]MDQ0363898.1 pimeloyl-ACP methyl ester carboxylesterase [Catenuloplanes indicus]